MKNQQHVRKHMSRSCDREPLTRKIIQLFPVKSTTPVRDNELRNMGQRSLPKEWACISRAICLKYWFLNKLVVGKIALSYTSRGKKNVFKKFQQISFGAHFFCIPRPAKNPISASRIIIILFSCYAFQGHCARVGANG